MTVIASWGAARRRRVRRGGRGAGQAHPAASRADIDYILDHVNAALAMALTHDDIEGVYVGLRPLLAGESEATSKLSREHAVARPRPGLISIAGGKYTTYRVMAVDAVDAARQDLGPEVGDSVTENIPLVGADGSPALVRADSTGLPQWRIQPLLDRYGSLLHELIDIADAEPGLWAPLESAPGYLRVEIVHAVSHEGALHLEDVMARRTRISIETPDRGVDSSDEVARLTAPTLEWDDDRVREEVKAYARRVAAELDSQRALGDTGANAERLAGPDIRRSDIRRSDIRQSDIRQFDPPDESEDQCPAGSSR